MNFKSKVYNQSAIYYAEWKKKEEQMRSLTNQSTTTSSETKDRNRDKPAAKRTSIKNLVFRSFLTSGTYHRDPGTGDRSGNFGNGSWEPKTETPEKKVDDRKIDPEIFFHQALIDIHAERFKFCLVGKFRGSRPSMKIIRDWVGEEWKRKRMLGGDWSISSLDGSHVFIRLDNQADMLHVWTRNRWFVKGHPMKVFKWTPSFQPSAAEPSLAAVWVSFPALPVVFYHEELLFPIASLLGRVFAVDEPTKNLTRTNVARACVEVDLLKELPRRVFIRIGDGGFWQDVRYEKLPSYCTGCSVQGHSSQKCKFRRNGDSGQMKKRSLHSEIDRKGRTKQNPQNASDYEDGETGPRTEEGSPSPQLLSDRYPAAESTENENEDGYLSRDASYDRITKKDDFLLQNGAEEDALQKTEEREFAGKTSQKYDSGKPQILVQIGAEEEDVNQNPCQQRKEATVNAKEDDGGRGELQKQDVVFNGSSCEKHAGTGRRRNGTSKSIIFFWRRNRKHNNQTTDINIEVPGPAHLRRYKYSDIEKMTKEFNEKLGEGGFATIFKGVLPDGRPVAVKMLDPEKHFAEAVFHGELETLGRTAHINVVELLGFCSEGSRRALVLELMRNESLHHFIHREEGPNRNRLTSNQMHKIAVGVARGLEFLHHRCNPSILHSDVKPGNILLDEDLCPKICDLGLSKLWWSSDCSPVPVRGTYGYIAPETFQSGRISTKSDVYGYGVTMLEMAAKRRPIDLGAGKGEERVLQNWVYRNLNGEEGFGEDETMRKMALVGLWCVQPDPGDRPSMSKVLQLLEGDVDELPMPPNPRAEMLPVEYMAFCSDSSL
ncbi:hypothetical protein H6P81_016722 [Aristolochia fimbriata]|uniref:Protein kinase domain-containing protein n=1 Tax=Aristolochia fimbriata TaxID=158543 RepID=A0AAV7ECC1_ARIFI|nr:hypothetical protein H6P81_016722 [Aristolochia fimbriata]